MTRKSATLSPAYFETKYKQDIDPWHFRTSAYEHEKYAATISALNDRMYNNALEVGCSIGVLTGLLALQCNRLIAIDASATAIATAKASAPAPSNVCFEVRTIPDGFPGGPFDLIVLSEVLYYFSPADLTRVAAKCLETLSSNGDIVLCHWLGETDYPLTGDEASDLFADAIVTRMPRRTILRNDVYRLEHFSAGEMLIEDASGSCLQS